ncbi:hypothetical protein ['Camptotheca acuminata' phytoplasma]|uniref:hypothetical protein n=1 Tax='Camptotheca acuminata' phytoplasma TaxID=3239192 RepID=UPI00351A7F7E
MIDLHLQKLFLESRLYPKLLQNNITQIKELILKKPKKYENSIISDLKEISDKQKVNLWGIIIKKPIAVKSFFKKSTQMFEVLVENNITFRVIIFHNFFFQIY